MVPRETRIDAREEVIVIDSSGVETRVVVSNVSREGCMIVGDGLLTVDEQVTIRTRRSGDLAATIRWVRGEEVGVEFADPPSTELD